MDDLKLMTVRALRELAKTHLGAGFSRLKTKAELIAALTKKLAVDAKAVLEDPAPVAPAPAAPAAKEPAPKAAAAQPASTQAKAPDAAPAAKAPPPEVSATPSLRKTRDGAGAPESEEAEPDAEAEELASEALDAEAADAEAEADGDAETESDDDDGEPLEEPVVAAPPPRVMSQAEIDLINENLGELPSGYHDDSVALLPRDPHTLWVCWDFSEATARQARENLPGARAVIRLFDGGHLVREVDVALESRSWYLHHVTPGRRYRAELAFVGPGQPPRRLGPTSNATLVPGEGPSPVIDERFISLPYEVPFARSAELLDHARPGSPFPRTSQDALLARAEEGLQVEGLRDDQVPVGESVEIYNELVRGLGGSETMVEIMKRRTRFGGLWTSSRPAAAWTSSKPG